MPRLEPLCRMLLVAERYGVALLRDHCLHCLATRFEALVEERAPPREREVFEAFVAAVAPQVPSSLAKAISALAGQIAQRTKSTSSLSRPRSAALAVLASDSAAP